MLILLAHFLMKYFSPLRLFNYISFRSIIACLFSLLFSIIIGSKVIKWLTKLKVGQMVRDDGPNSHLIKTGTPTMGGVLIIISVIITNLIFADLTNRFIWLLLFVLTATGLIGFVDDYKKIVHKNAKGLSGRKKMLFQTIITLVVAIYLYYVIKLPHLSEIVVPFSKSIFYEFGFISFLLMCYFVIVGSSNAVNLTDGLDGLVSLPVITVTLGLCVFSYIAGNKIYANYLFLPHILGSQEIVVFCCSLVGATLGFLWYNAYPARVFMGDVGALAIGAVLGTIAIIVRQELAFALIAGLFVVEALSVILQVVSFKLRKKRIFLMAPIHHHFELKGWKENQVVVRFWIITIILLLIGLSTIKLR